MGASWETQLRLVEFSYNNSHHASIGMPPFEALYGRPYHTPLCWTEVEERQNIELAIILDTIGQMKIIKIRFREAHDRHKSYADKRRKDSEFVIGDLVYLKMRIFKGLNRWAKREKLKLIYMVPYPIIEGIGAVAYRLNLLEELEAFHNVFHVCVLKKLVMESELIIQQPPEDLEQDLSIRGKPVSIMSHIKFGSQEKKAKAHQVRWEIDGIHKTFSGV